MRTAIVTSALIEEGERILVTQREEGDDQALLWEFPGGKVEEGEDPRQALIRELGEELGIEVEVGALFDAAFEPDPNRPILLLVYRCRIKGGFPQSLGCRDFRWVDPGQLRALAMPPADGPVRSRWITSRSRVLNPEPLSDFMPEPR